MIYVVDLDDTICYPDHSKVDTYSKYSLAKPNDKVIQKLRWLKSEGHTIIIHSARRMLTHKGNLAAIENDVGSVTRQWLTEYAVPYDELIFGKPYADAYVDDKAVTLEQFLSIGCSDSSSVS